ncbi:hypothetical protein Tco_0909480 [Tanacetum coccineum]|uniref:Uncharacterized protein n=1 Tax=Tanacetum coccineum TaxID=301880 RepID=A0ABQ5CQ33_9ASTR
MPEDTVDHMENRVNVLKMKETKGNSDEEKELMEVRLISTDGSKVSTDRQIEGTDEQVKGTEEHNEGTEDKNEGTEELREGTEEKVESTDGQVKRTEDQTEEEIVTQTSTINTPTSMIFGDDETILKCLLNMTEKKFKQLESDEELARKVQEEWEAEEERNKIAEENAANEDLIRDFDDIKARIEADRLLAEKLQEQEREQFTIEERANDQEGKQRRSSKEDKDEKSTEKENLELGKKMKSRKRRYIQYTSEDDSDKENDELRLYLTVAQDEEKEVDYEILDRKYPIKEWKTECLGAKPQTDQAEHLEEINLNVVIRRNGQERYFHEMPEGFDRVLWGDLMVLFNPDDKDEFNHPYAGRELVERRYPLSKDLLQRMLDLGLEVERESSVALDLIRFIKQQIDEE